MAEIKEITQLTHNKHLNMYELKGNNKVGGPVDYFVASRAKTIDEMKQLHRQ